MLFKEAILQAISAGRIHLAFRRWEKPRVKPGTRTLTSHGLIEVKDVSLVKDFSEKDAVAAGSPDRTTLWKELHSGRPGSIYRITLRHADADPRLALRSESELKPTDHALLQTALHRLDARSQKGPWTHAILQAVKAHPHMPAAYLSTLLGCEKE